MDPYADYTFYTDEYHGTSIAEADFPALALKATAAIDRFTFNRAVSETDADIVEKIKLAMCAVAEEYQSIEASDGEDGISSETVGRHSVSYIASASKSRSNDQRVEDAMGLWLGVTGLLFKGFNPGEYGSSVVE